MAERVISQKVIWYINKYASPPGANGGLRGLSLAREFAKKGHLAIVLNSRANHYLTGVQHTGKRAFRSFDHSENWGVSTYTHKTITYNKTASARRILSWFHFEWGLLWLPTRKLPKPTHIIVSSLSLLTVLNGYRLSRKTGASLVFEIRDIWPLSMVTRTNLSRRNILIRFLSWVEKFGYTNADAIVGQMPNLAEHVEEVLGSSRVVHTVGLGVDPELQEFLTSATNYPQNSVFRVVYAGSIGRANALENFLQVAKSFSDDSSIVFELFGKGDFLHEYALRHSPFPRIIFHGAVPRRQLFSEIQAADAVFLAVDRSEIWRFGQSLHKVVEYMALGRPIIAEYEGYPSMINEAGCGVFVPPGDSERLRATILELKAMSPEKLHEMGDKGRNWVLENRAYENLADEYLEILDSIDPS